MEIFGILKLFVPFHVQYKVAFGKVEEKLMNNEEERPAGVVKFANVDVSLKF